MVEARFEPLLSGSRVNAPNCQAVPVYLQFYVEMQKGFLQITSNKWYTYTYVHTQWFNYTPVHLNKKCFFKKYVWLIPCSTFLKIFIYLAVPGLSCSKWNLVTEPGMEPKPPALEEWSPSQQKIREVLFFFLIINIFKKFIYQRPTAR